MITFIDLEETFNKDAEPIALDDLDSIYKMHKGIWPFNTPPYLWTSIINRPYDSGFWSAWREVAHLVNETDLKYNRSDYDNKITFWTARPTEEQFKNYYGDKRDSE